MISCFYQVYIRIYYYNIYIWTRHCQGYAGLTPGRRQQYLYVYIRTPTKAHKNGNNENTLPGWENGQIMMGLSAGFDLGRAVYIYTKNASIQLALVHIRAHFIKHRVTRSCSENSKGVKIPVCTQGYSCSFYSIITQRTMHGYI